MKVWEIQHRNSQKKHPTIQSNTEFTCCPVYLTHNRDSLRVYAAISHVPYGSRLLPLPAASAANRLQGLALSATAACCTARQGWSCEQ